MTKTFIIENGQKLTQEQLKEIEEAQNSPVVFDEDCEKLSPAMVKAFKSAVVQRNRKKKAQVRECAYEIKRFIKAGNFKGKVVCSLYRRKDKIITLGVSQ